MLQPSRTKYRKAQRGVIKGLATRGSDINFGEYALKTTESGYLTSRQIESARKTMGGGKGSVDMYRAPVKPGRILFEISGIAPEVAREAFSLAAYKLPVKTKLIMSKNEM